MSPILTSRSLRSLGLDCNPPCCNLQPQQCPEDKGMVCHQTLPAGESGGFESADHHHKTCHTCPIRSTLRGRNQLLHKPGPQPNLQRKPCHHLLVPSQSPANEIVVGLSRTGPMASKHPRCNLGA